MTCSECGLKTVDQPEPPPQNAIAFDTEGPVRHVCPTCAAKPCRGCGKTPCDEAAYEDPDYGFAAPTTIRVIEFKPGEQKSLEQVRELVAEPWRKEVAKLTKAYGFAEHLLAKADVDLARAKEDIHHLENALQAKTELRLKLRSAVTEAWETLHLAFGWLNFEPRGLCICHHFKGEADYDDPDTYQPPTEHTPECDGYNTAMEILNAARKEAE